MPQFTQVRNTTNSGVNFHFGDFSVIRLLPGLNLIEDSEFELLNQHPTFSAYQKVGILDVVNLNVDNLRTDEDTNLKLTEDDFGDDIPVFKVDANSNIEVASDYAGRVFKATDYKKVGIDTNLMKQIHKMTPPKGWINGEQITTTVGIVDEEMVTKVNSLFN